VECESARQLMVFARPGTTELDAAEVAALESHLAECPDCRAQCRSERAWDDRITRAMRAVTVPPDSRARLNVRLQHERGAWLRRMTCQVAAAVLAVVSIWWMIPAPSLDAEMIAAEAYDQVGNRDGVEAWLIQQNQFFGFPPRMDAKYLIACERRDFHGAKAPVLTFVRQNARACVAVLSSKQFRNLSKLPDGRAAANSVCTLLIVRDPNTPDVVYLVEVINGPVELFYNELEATVS
jgi:Putative zinc-finger